MITICTPSTPESLPIQRVTFGLGQPIAIHVSGDSVTSNNGTFYLHTDHLGSTSYLTKSTGGKVNGSDARYQPFGPYRTTPAQTITDTGYTRQHHNPSLGLIYYNARYYAPALARFISPDTIVPAPTNPQSFNRYAYVLNSPINRNDPTGHISCDSINLPEGDRFACAVTPPPPSVSYAAQACAGWDLLICNDPSSYPSNELIHALANRAFAEIASVEEVEDYPNLETLRLYIAILLLAAANEGLSQDEVAYLLATAYSESRFGVLDFGLMEDRSDENAEEVYGYLTQIGRDHLGNIQIGDGAKYKGRGFVQLTGRWQYQKVGNLLGIDLINNPDLATDPRWAAIIAARGMKEGWFTTSTGPTYNFARYTNPDGHLDFLNARYIIHGNGYNKYTVRNRVNWFLPILQTYSYP